MESRKFSQLGLDFTPADGYIDASRKEDETLDHELFEMLERRVDELVEKYNALKNENAALKEENQRYLSEREGLKSRFDAIIGKLDGV